MSALRALLTCVSVPLLGLVACAGLKVADDPADGDAGTFETPGDLDASSGGGPDVEVPDAANAPADFACDGDSWTKPKKTKKECEPRQVRVVDPIAPIQPNGVSIARTPMGRVGIVYNAQQGFETCEMHLVHFVPDKPGFPAPVIVKRSTGFAFHDGDVAKLTAAAPDKLHVLAHDVEDISQSGEVNLYTLEGGKEPFAGPELGAAAVKRPAELAVRADGTGNVYATVRIATDATTAKLAAFKRTSNGVTPLPNLATALLPGDAPGIGAASLAIDPTGVVHLLFHYNEVQQHSAPRYHALGGTDWSYRKTVDNATPQGLSGFSPALAVAGPRKYAAYYFRKALQNAPVTAELRLATWQSSMDTPQIEVLDQGIPSSDALYPLYRVAMAADVYGLLHLAIIRPTSEDGSTGYLEYRRQTPETGGGTKWLSDIVDPDVLSAGGTAHVDLVVDGDARPHIAYRSALDGQVRYATRFDR